MGVLEQQDGAVEWVSWPLPSGLASGILNAHFWPHPAADMIKWVLLETLYLVDVFQVVYEAICAPLSISLGSHLHGG